MIINLKCKLIEKKMIYHNLAHKNKKIAPSFNKLNGITIKIIKNVNHYHVKKNKIYLVKYFKIWIIVNLIQLNFILTLTIHLQLRKTGMVMH